MTFGSCIRQTCKSMGLTLDDVERTAKEQGYRKGLTARHLSKIEKGRTMPSFRIVVILSNVLQLDLRTLAEYFKKEEKREKRERPEMTLEEALEAIIPVAENHRLDPDRGTKAEIEKANHQIEAIERLRRYVGS